MTDVRFFFDPVCPWTWITSRWLVEVAEQRDFEITWEIFSLRHHNRDNPGYDWLRDEMDAQYPALRVIEAVKARDGNDAVARLYTALGTVIHHQGDDNLTRLEECIASVGLEPNLIDEAHRCAWDRAIVDSTEAARSLVGDDAGIPLIVIPDNPTILFGPVLSPAPSGAAALELWDAFVALGRCPGLYEIKRTRNVRPILGAAPAHSITLTGLPAQRRRRPIRRGRRRRNAGRVTGTGSWNRPRGL